MRRLISFRSKKDEEMTILIQDVNENDFQIYAPLLAGLKVQKRRATIYYILFLIRRIILVSTIFLLEEPKLLFVQMQVFMLGSLGILVYDCAASPFESLHETVIEVINELNVLFVAYCALQLLYSSHDA